jgi:polysaccharide biosynthesis protein PslG
MRNTIAVLILLLLSLRAHAQIPRSFFGMHILHSEQHSWPDVRFGALRLWDSHTTWAQLNPADGKYDWKHLDELLDDAQSHGVEVLYTFGHTPQWASSDPHDRSCGGPRRAGDCDPPDDLKADGSGSDAHWKTFVAAIAKHARGRIRHWEVWNEPFNHGFWTGSFPQMVRMAQDARTVIKSIDPDATVLSPSTGLRNPRAYTWFEKYLEEGGGQYADAISFHSYLRQPGNLPSRLDDLRQQLAHFGQGEKPLWDTECSWGNTAEVEDHSSVIAQLYTLQASEGVKHVFWYAWDNGRWGTLWTPDAGTLPAASIFDKLQDWLVGASFSRPCQQSGGAWSCDITLGNSGPRGRIMWSDEEHGEGGNYKLPSEFGRVRALNGSEVKSGSTSLSPRPVLLLSGKKP